MKTTLRFLSFLLFIGMVSPSFAQYEVFDYPGADHTYVTGMNDQGDFVGYYIAGGITRGFAVMGADTMELIFPGSAQTYAHGINNERDIVGKYNDSGAQTDNEGFLYDYSLQDYTDLTFLLNNGNYTQVTDINDDGCWAGSFRSGTSAYLMRDCNGHTTDRYNLLSTFGTAINEWGDVAGYYIDGAEYTSFIRTGPGLFFLINYPNNIKTRIFGMNDLNMVVGDFANSKGFLFDGFNQGGTAYEEIIIPDAITVTPQDINNEEQICGYFTDAQGNTHGFLIRGYDIGFRPQPDGWFFPNEESALWPSDEWFDIEYIHDPYLKEKYGLTGPFPKNGEGALDFFESDIFPSWPLMVETFGEEQFYTEVNGVLKGKWQSFEVWKEFATEWKGSCYGMGYSSLMYYKDASVFHSKFPEMPSSMPSIYSQSPTDAVRDVNNKLQIYQASKAVKDQIWNEYNPTPNQTLTQIKAMMTEEDPDYFGISISNTNGSGSHLVVPFKVEKGQSSGWWDVFVYDSNHPNDTTRKIQVNKQATAFGGAWYYEAAGNVGQGEVEWGGPTANYGFKAAPAVSEHVATPPIGENFHGQGNSRASEYVTAYFSDGAEELFLYGNDSLGYYNGRLVATTANGIPYTNATNAAQKPIGYLLDVTEAHAATVSGSQDGKAYMTITTETGLLSYSREDATPSQMDEALFDAGGLTYTNPDPDPKTVSLKAYASYLGADYQFWIKGVNCEQGAELHIEPINGNELIVTNTGEAKTYDLTISILSPTDASTFEVPDVPFAEDGIHHIVPFWNNLNDDGIYITVDTSTVGVDDTLFLANQALPILELSNGVMEFDNLAGSDELFVINSGGGELQWNVASAPAWVTVTSGSSGTEDGSVSFDVTANTGPDRSGWLVINSNDVNSPDSVWIWQGFSSPVSVDETLTDEKDHVVYPNPVSDILTVGLSPELPDATILIRDMQGKLMETRSYSKSDSELQRFDMHRYSAGMYLVEVSTGGTRKFHKIIKR